MITESLEQEIAERVNALSIQYVGRALMRASYKDMNWENSNIKLLEYTQHLRLYIKMKRACKRIKQQADFDDGAFSHYYLEFMHHKNAKNRLRQELTELGINYLHLHKALVYY